MSQKIEPFVHTDAEDPETRFVTSDMRPLEYVGYSERQGRHIFVFEDSGEIFQANEDYVLTVRDAPPVRCWVVLVDWSNRVIAWKFKDRREAEDWVMKNGGRGYTIGEVSW